MRVHARKLNKLCEKVKKLRKQQNLTQEELAARIGVSAAYIGFIEQGQRTPSIKTADKIARVLGAKFSDIVFSADFDKESYKFHYLVGPVKKKEAMARLNCTFPLEEADFSDNMVFLDIDGYAETELNWDELKDNVGEIQEKINNMANPSLAIFKV